MILTLKVIGVLAVILDLLLVAIILRKRSADRYWKSKRKAKDLCNPWAGEPIEPIKLAELNAERWHD